jgi:hypothetical protein
MLTKPVEVVVELVQPDQVMTELTVVTDRTNSLTVRDQEKSELIAVLSPIAGRIQEYQRSAASIVVETPAQYKNAAELVKRMKADEVLADTTLREFSSGLIDRLHKLHRGWTAGLGMFVNPINEARASINKKLAAYEQEQERIAEEKRQKLQAEEDERVRKQVAEQERLARIQREKEEQARLAEEEARRKAAAEQDAVKRKQLEAEAERKRKEADAAAAKAAERDERAASVAPAVVIQVESAAPVVEGVSSRKAWKATVTDKKAFVAFAAQDVTGMFLGTVEINEVALGKLAKGDKAPTLPGVRFTLETIVASRSR